MEKLVEEKKEINLIENTEKKNKKKEENDEDDETRPILYYFDSLGFGIDKKGVKIRQYLTNRILIEKKIEFDFSGNIIQTKSLKLPQQNNHCDCGVFLLHYFELFLELIDKNKNLKLKLNKNWFDIEEIVEKREIMQVFFNDVINDEQYKIKKVESTPESCNNSSIEEISRFNDDNIEEITDFNQIKDIEMKEPDNEKNKINEKKEKKNTFFEEHFIDFDQNINQNDDLFSELNNLKRNISDVTKDEVKESVKKSKRVIDDSDEEFDIGKVLKHDKEKKTILKVFNEEDYLNDEEKENENNENDPNTQ
jgi:hypothetical protein